MGCLYPTFERNPAARRAARAGATPGVGLQRREARFRPRWLRPVSFTLVGSGSDVREVSQFSTRSGVLRASRGEASGPHDPKGHRSNNPFISSILSCSGRALRGWAKGPARRPGGSTNRKSTAHSSSARPLAPLMRRSRRGRRFLSESRYSLSTPKHCPVLTSLRLRCRSAAFSRALRDSSIFGAPPK